MKFLAVFLNWCSCVHIISWNGISALVPPQFYQTTDKYTIIMVWTPSWTGWHICPKSHARLPGSGIYTWVKLQRKRRFFSFLQRCAALFSLSNCWFRSFEVHLFAVYLEASFCSLPWGKWSFVELFELLVANISKASYHDIRNLCWGVFSSKLTLRFAPPLITTYVGSNQLPISGGT